MCVTSLHQQRIVQGREVAESGLCRTMRSMPAIDSTPVWGPLITMIENTSDEVRSRSALLIELRSGSTASALASVVTPPLPSRAQILAQATEHGIDDEG